MKIICKSTQLKLKLAYPAINQWLILNVENLWQKGTSDSFLNFSFSLKFCSSAASVAWCFTFHDDTTALGPLSMKCRLLLQKNYR